MLYLIGLGLNVYGISREGIEILKRCKKIYLDDYTVDFPYSIEELAHELDKKIFPADREFIESLRIVDEARKMDIALLVYGSPLTATTHITLVEEAKNSGIKTRLIYSASILDAVAETGLQIYKFGKIASMPKWIPENSFVPESFMDIVKENISIKAHTLILVDIGLEFQEALNQLETSMKNKNLKFNKIIVCSCLGTKRSKIFYKKIEELKEYEDIRSPYCFIIPENLHFVEKEVLENFR